MLQKALSVAFVLLLLLSGAGSGAQSKPASPDYPALLKQMRVIQAVIDETMGQTFLPPFGLLKKADGTYLPGFGVVFSLEVNLYPLRVPSPFDPRPLSKDELEKSRRGEMQRIEAIKKGIPRLLADHARGLRELNPGDSVAVVVHLFRVQLQGDQLPTQLVFQVKKSDLEDFWNQKLSFEELVSKTRVLEL